MTGCHVCDGMATIASVKQFDEPIGSAGKMLQCGLCNPPARPVVMTKKTMINIDKYPTGVYNIGVKRKEAGV